MTTRIRRGSGPGGSRAAARAQQPQRDIDDDAKSIKSTTSLRSNASLRSSHSLPIPKRKHTPQSDNLSSWDDILGCDTATTSSTPAPLTFEDTNANKHKKDDDIISVAQSHTKERKSNMPHISEDRPFVSSSNRSLANGEIHYSANLSVFTDKKQDDLDKLFEDLIGPSKDDVSIASTAMSSIMPHTLSTPMIRARNQHHHDERSLAHKSIAEAEEEVSVDSKISKDVSTIDPYISKKYIFSSQANKKKTSKELLNQNNKNVQNGGGGANHLTRLYAMKKKRMTDIRAALTVMFLVGVMFVAVQLSSVVQNDRKQMQKLRNEHQFHQVGQFSSHAQGGYIEESASRAMLTTTVDENAGGPMKIDALPKQSGVDEFATDDDADAMVTNKHLLRNDQKPLLRKAKMMDVEVDNSNNIRAEDHLDVGDILAGDTGPVDSMPERDEMDVVLDNEPPPPMFDLDNFADLSMDTPFIKNRDIPFFWYIPSSGAITLRTIFGKCMGATLAAEQGSKNAYSTDPNVEVFRQDDVKYVNVDTTYVGGIERGKQIKLVESGMVDIIISPYVHQSSSLFTPINRGRFFAVFRHPIFRAATQYEYLKQKDPEIAAMTLVQYASSKKVENNWMTRFLSGKLTGEVTSEHLVIAKDILKNKCLVGMYDKMWASLKRYEEYFGWQYVTSPKEQYDCRKQALTDNVDGFKYPEQTEIKEGDNEWTMLLWQNKFDMKLFFFAKELFIEQAALFPEGKVPV